MTKLTLQYLDLLEKIRNNNVIADLRDRELMELIRNNRRVFKINLDKNTIQKAYNDELDTRERDKLEKQVSVDLRKLEETIRHDKASEVNERYGSTISAFGRGKMTAATIGAVVGIANQEANRYTTGDKPAIVTETARVIKRVEPARKETTDYRNFRSMSPTQAQAYVNAQKNLNNKEVADEIISSKEKSSEMATSRGKSAEASYKSAAPTQQTETRGDAKIVYSKGTERRNEVGPGIGLAFK